MDLASIKVIAVAIIGFSLSIIGWALASMLKTALEYIGRNPEAKDAIYSTAIVLAAFVESVVLLAWMLAAMLLFM